MAWFDDLNLPGATIDGFFGYVTADGPDEDDNPDVSLANGTVTFTATTPAARVDGAWLGIQSVTGVIFDGQLVVSEENPLPIRLLATDANIGVADWAWKATFDIKGFTLAPLTFKAPRGTTVNLTADLIPIKSQPYQIIEGASIVDAEVDDTGRMRFEMSDGTLTRWVDVPNGEQGIQGDRGEKGDKGADGVSATLTMGSVSQGSVADAWMTGTVADRVLHLTVPRGAKGERGDGGARGPEGPLAAPVVTSSEPGVYEVGSKSRPLATEDIQGLSEALARVEYTSGTRDISEMVPTDQGWVAGARAKVIRNGQQVSLSVLDLGRDEAGTGYNTVAIMPYGFRPAVDQYFTTWRNVRARILPNGTVQLHAAGTQLDYLSATFLVATGPPTSPPGDPA